MAKASWLSASPLSGNGNGSVSVSTASPHTGRTARTTNLTFKAAGVTDKVVNVNQAGKPEFVTIQSSASALKAGGLVTITGVTNSSKLTFSLGAGSLGISLPASYLANSVSTNNNVAIVGDPGAGAELNFSIEITVPENVGVTELSKQITVTANGGQSANCTLTQAAGDATLSVDPLTVELTWEGTSTNVTVTSNTSWTVE